ncbi:hypothetical protein KX928_04915 [Roseobacter sp. YSTF-M11]|uniref:Uncharacterized protein n=1 Tax=Roseobacter insulae TaxID=2859783 RepID=A0A9X1FT28_9RHOB|nr:hypothetical protein [Roseobacter insulae]MBW4707122.1 hypothetical protein [Roseobacter insulae]
MYKDAVSMATSRLYNQLGGPISGRAPGAMAAVSDVVNCFVRAGAKDSLALAAAEALGRVDYCAGGQNDRVVYLFSQKDSYAPLAWVPLWMDQSQPAEMAEYWEKLKAQFDADAADWSFWIEWYERILLGDPMPWDLVHRIAMEVADAEWDAGPATVARRIKEIRLNWRTETSRRLVYDDKAGVFVPEHPLDVQSGTLTFVMHRVRNALGSALATGQTNGFSETSYEAVHLQPILLTDNPEPTLFATTCWDACMALDRNIGDLYPEDASLMVLKNTLYTAIEELSDENALIKARIGRLAALRTNAYPTASDRQEMAKLPNELGPELNSEAQEIYQSDIEIILSNPKPPRSVRARVTNWTTTIFAWMDRTKKGDGRLKWLASVVNRLSRWWSGSGE